MSVQTIDRDVFLSALLSCQCGLSETDVVEQSASFAFVGGYVHTFNDEVAAQRKLKLNFEGAVKAAPLIATLSKFREPQVDLQVKGKADSTQLIISGKKRKAGLPLEPDIALPIGEVSKPKKWAKLHEKFAEAVATVEGCAGNNPNEFVLTCIHLTPKFVEASDSVQVCRYKIKTGLKEELWMRRDSLRDIAAMDMTEICETDSWIHFRNDIVQVAIRKRVGESYPDLSPYLDPTKPRKAQLPKGLAEAVEKAEVFSKTDETNEVSIALTKGKLVVRGEGSAGWFTESRKVEWKGKDMKFFIAPDILRKLLANHNECEIGKDSLRVSGSNFQYTTSLALPEADNG